MEQTSMFYYETHTYYDSVYVAKTLKYLCSDSLETETFHLGLEQATLFLIQ